MIIDFEDIEPSFRYKLTSQSVIPRPIAWIVTEDENIINIAPFSYFTPLSSNPPTLIVSIGHKSNKTPKDTLANIRKNGKCTICIADINQLEKMHFSSAELDKEESEAKKFDIKTVKLLKNFPPMTKNSPIAFFCEFYKEVELESSKTVPLILKIYKEYIDDKIIKNKEKLYIDFEPIARVGAQYRELGKKIKPPKIVY